MTTVSCCTPGWSSGAVEFVYSRTALEMWHPGTHENSLEIFFVRIIVAFLDTRTSQIYLQSFESFWCSANFTCLVDNRNLPVLLFIWLLKQNCSPLIFDLDLGKRRVSYQVFCYFSNYSHSALSIPRFYYFRKNSFRLVWSPDSSGSPLSPVSFSSLSIVQGCFRGL